MYNLWKDIQNEKFNVSLKIRARSRKLKEKEWNLNLYCRIYNGLGQSVTVLYY